VSGVAAGLVKSSHLPDRNLFVRRVMTVLTTTVLTTMDGNRHHTTTAIPIVEGVAFQEVLLQIESLQHYFAGNPILLFLVSL
jgi:hypothetical protein